MQLYVLDKDPWANARALDNRLVTKMLIELMQMLSTHYRNQGIRRDYFYKPIPQGKELVEWIGKNIDWVLVYMHALAEVQYERFGIKCLEYASYNNAKRFARDFQIHAASEIYTVSFRCKKEYPKYLNLNKILLPVAIGVQEYKEYYKWNLYKIYGLS